MIAKTDSTGHEMARLAKWEEAITGIKFDSIVAALLVWLVGGSTWMAGLTIMRLSIVSLRRGMPSFTQASW